MESLSEIRQTEISGVVHASLREIEAEGGPVLHMMRRDGPLFEGFGEVYFSVVLPGAIKAWKRHSRQTQNLATPVGLVDIVLYDSRPDSPSKGKIAVVRLGRPGHYRLLRIPPGVWYGFTGCSEQPSVLANCVDIPHAPEESERLPKDSPEIPWSWERQAPRG